MVTISAAAMSKAIQQVLATAEDSEGRLVGLVKLLNKIEKEQPEIIDALYVLGCKQPFLLKGFVLAYLTIQNQLEVDELAKLEKLGRL